MEQLCFCVFLAVKQMPKGKWICLDLGGSSVAFKSPASRSDVSATDLMTGFLCCAGREPLWKPPGNTTFALIVWFFVSFWWAAYGLRSAWFHQAWKLKERKGSEHHERFPLIFWGLVEIIVASWQNHRMKGRVIRESFWVQKFLGTPRRDMVTFSKEILDHVHTIFYFFTRRKWKMSI